MKKINTAIVGCGLIHRLHIDGIKRIDDAKVIAVCDINMDRANRAADQNGCRAYFDYNEMLNNEDIDVVHICTPHYLHAPMAKTALKQGMHVVLEKPMAMNAAEAKELIDVDDKCNNKLGVIFQNRYKESTKKTKEIIDSNEYGSIKTIRGNVSWHRSKAYYDDDWHGTLDKEGGGVLINQAIHTLDLVQWLTGSKPISVSGSVTNDSLKGHIEVEDTAHMFIKFENGIKAVFYATNAYGINAEIEVEVVLDDVILLLRGDHLYMDKGNGDGLERIMGKACVKGEKSYWGNTHNDQIIDFYDSVRYGKKITIGARDGYNAVAILDAVYKSSRTNCEVLL